MTATHFEASGSSSRLAWTVGLLSLLWGSPGMIRAQDVSPTVETPTQESASADVKRLDRDARRRLRTIIEAALRARTQMEDASQRLFHLRIEHQNAEAAHLQAKFAREVAEIAVVSYTEGTSKSELTAAKAEIGAEEAALDQATDDLKKLDAIRQKSQRLEARFLDELMTSYRIELALNSAQNHYRKQESRLEQAKGKLTFLEKHAIPARTLTLKSEVEKARSNEMVQQQSVMLARDKLEAAERSKGQSTKGLPTIFSMLDGAVGLERELRAMVGDASSVNLEDRESRDAKARALAAKLDAALDEVEDRWDDFVFNQLSERTSGAASEGRADASPGKFGPLLERLQKLSSEDQQAFRNASKEQRIELLKKAGFSDAELKQMFKPRSPTDEKP